MNICLIVGNSSKRFSGVTSTMLQVLPHQTTSLETWVLGNSNLPEGVRSASFWQVLAMVRSRKDTHFVFHARRNDEMIQGLLLKWFAKAPIKMFFTSTAQRFHSAFSRWLMRQMDEVISTCDAAASYMARKPSMLVPHGIDIERFNPVPDKVQAMATLGYPERRGVGIFGRVRHQKGVDVLVDAMLPILVDHPDVDVFIVGEITAAEQGFAEQLQQKILQHGAADRIHILGKQPFADLPKWFAAMDIVCALSRNEGFGLTVLEALASGSAVVASQAGAWPDILAKDDVGLLVECGNVEQTQQAIDVLLKDNERRSAMAIRGRVLIEKDYTVEREAKQLCDFAKQLANS
jgi:mannosyltransferase